MTHLVRGTPYIDGRAQAQEIHARLRLEVESFVSTVGVRPHLSVLLVGDHEPSQIYVRNKEKAARNIGIDACTHFLPAALSQEALLEKIQELNQSPETHAILLQLPLPSHLNAEKAIQALDPKKDVDGLHPHNLGLLVRHQEGLIPCTPLGCLRLLKSCHATLAGKKVLIIGRSVLVGMPLSLLLTHHNATVTLAHSKTENLPEQCRQADVVITAVGHPHLVRGDWIKPGATVIDVGINRLPDRLVGDVHLEEVSKVARYVTPVPGGVGPMTIACLMENTLKAARLQLLT